MLINAPEIKFYKYLNEDYNGRFAYRTGTFIMTAIIIDLDRDLGLMVMEGP